MYRKLVLAISTIAASAIFILGSGSALTQTTTYTNSAREFRGPQIYKSARSGILFYVESDGRHVSALDPVGKILWCRDPFGDAGLKPYRVEKPLIVAIGPPLDWMVKGMASRGKNGELILINFNSSQTGVLDASSGDFTFMGQD
jgi:hypothetical protein